MYSPDPYTSDFQIYLLIVPIIIGLLMAFIIVKKRYTYLPYCYVIIFVMTLILLTLPMINHPFFDRTDLLSHLSFIKDILLYGHIPNYPIKNIGLSLYPASHLLLAIYSIISKVNVVNLRISNSILFIEFVVQFIVGTLFIKRFLNNAQASLKIITAIMISSPLAVSLNYGSIPIIFSIFLFFYLSLLYYELVIKMIGNHKYLPVKRMMIALLLIISISMYHPLILLAISVFSLLYILLFKFANMGSLLNSNAPIMLSKFILIINSIIFIMKVLYLKYYLALGIEKILHLLTSGPIGQTRYFEFVYLYTKRSLNDLLLSFVKMYPFSLIILPSMIMMIADFTFLLRKKWRSDEGKNSRLYFLAQICNWIFLSALNIFIVEMMGFWRMLFALQFFSMFYLTISLNEFIKGRNISMTKISFWSSLIVALVILSTFAKSISIRSFYPSPFTGWQNQAISINEYEGVSFLYGEKTLNTRVISFSPRFPLMEAIYGQYIAQMREDGRFGQYREMTFYGGPMKAARHKKVNNQYLLREGDLIIISYYDTYYHDIVYQKNIIDIDVMLSSVITKCQQVYHNGDVRIVTIS